MPGNDSKRYFTKTLFSLARECPTKLYYVNKVEYPNEKEADGFLSALAEGGFQVGALAKCYYPEGVEVRSLDDNEALRETACLLRKDRITIFEAAICLDGFFIRVDILRKDGDHLDLIEVKSKSYHPDEEEFITQSGGISSAWSPYLYDVAFQTYVLRRAFPKFIISPYLMLVDKSKTTSIDGLNQRFKLKKVNDHSKVVINGDVNLQALGACRVTSV